MAAKTKVVKVCGRRPNTNAPQSWWVDTGIYVTAGNQLIIDPTNPGNYIRTWNGSPSWTPWGKTTETTWHDTLAYRESELETASFSLIGKIGRSGNAFSVGGAVKTFTPSASGTLFLACNDGYSFLDNTGYWNVSVTFEELVQLLPTGYGTEMIYADRVNGKLVDDWGVILTVEEGVASNHTWNVIAVDNVVAALTAIDNRLRSQAGRTFKEVFAGTEMRLSNIPEAGFVSYLFTNTIRFGTETFGTTDPRLDDREYGQITPRSATPSLNYYPSSIPYGFFNGNDKGIQNTVIHELGHIFANRTDVANPTGSMYDFAQNETFALRQIPALNWTSTTQDATDDVGVFWENRDPIVGEFVPDNFLNWVRNSYVNIPNVDIFNASYTDADKRISAYWTGTQITDTNGNLVSTPGITGFASDAYYYMINSGASSLIYNIGSGEINPNCL